MVDTTMTIGKRSPLSLLSSPIPSSFSLPSTSSPTSIPKLSSTFSSSILHPTTPSKHLANTTPSNAFITRSPAFLPSSSAAFPTNATAYTTNELKVNPSITPSSSFSSPKVTSSSISPVPNPSLSRPSSSFLTNVSSTSTSTLYFGFLNESIYSQLSPSNTDWRTRSSAIELLHQSILQLQPSPPLFLIPHLDAFLNFMATLLHDPNFKVVLTSLFALSDLLTKFDLNLIQVTIPKLLSLLILKLEDSKMILRQAVFKIIAQLTHVITPQPMLSMITHYLASNQPRVKEQVVNVVISILLLFPKCALDLANIVADLLVALIDPNPRIKYVAVEAYSVLAARHGAEKILSLLKSYGLEEDTLTALRIRFTNPMLPVLTPDGMVDHIIHLRSSSSSTSSTNFSSSSSTLSSAIASSRMTPMSPYNTTITAAQRSDTIASLFASTLAMPLSSSSPIFTQPFDSSYGSFSSTPTSSPPVVTPGSQRTHRSLSQPTPVVPLHHRLPLTTPRATEKKEKLSSTDIRASQSLKSAPTVISRTLPSPSFTFAPPSSSTLPSSSPRYMSSNSSFSSSAKESSASTATTTVSPSRRPKPGVEDPKTLVLQLNTGDWELQQKTLDTIQAYLPDQKHIFAPVLGDLTMAVLGQVTNLRSGVARPAILTLSQLLLHCGKDMDPNLTEPILTCLLKKYSDPKEFLMDSIDRALTNFVNVHWPSNRVLPVLFSWSMHKHSGIRYKTAVLFKECLSQLNESQLTKWACSTVEQTRMVPVVLGFLRDGNKETRLQAKAILELLNKVPGWFQLMEKLVNGSQLLDIKKVLHS